MSDPLLQAFIALDLLCSTLPLAFSVLYHTFMCHRSGKQAYLRLLKLDILGVWLSGTLGAIPSIYAGMYCFAFIIGVIFFLVYLLVACVVLYYLLVVDSKQRRAFAMTIEYFFRVSVHLCQFITRHPTGLQAAWQLLTMDVLMAVGVFINTLHVPELWFQGKVVDYLLNGHSLMHICAVAALLLAHQVFLYDINWIMKGAVCPI